MVQTITVTPSWQIHLPVEFRKKLGLKEPGKMEMILEKDKIILKPKKSQVLKMAGKYKDRKPQKKINIDRVRDSIDYSKL
jgi:AbrB family looped-hinge helix DNA binding protein